MAALLLPSPPEVVKRLYWLRSSDPIPEELRGWSYTSFPVKPRSYLGIGVSEVAYRYCETFRDIWLRRKMGSQGEVEENSPIFWGKVAHFLIDAAIKDSSELFSRGLSLDEISREVSRRKFQRAFQAGRKGDANAAGFYSSIAILHASELYSQLIRGKDPSSILGYRTEFVVDGTPLGLSPQLRVDAFHESGIIVEYKLGNGVSADSADRYAPGLAGYALAIESTLGIPVDWGIVVKISSVSSKFKVWSFPVYISSTYRRIFLDNRDDAIEVLMRASPPPVSSSCQPACPYYKICRGNVPK